MASSPPTKICSVPALAPAAMPLTGASRIWTGPAFFSLTVFSSATERTRSATAGTDVDMSIQTEPGASPDSRPSAPSSTCSTLATVGSMVITTSRPAPASRGEAAHAAPAASSSAPASRRMSWTSRS